MKLLIAGTGALGSHLASLCARLGTFELVVVDHDRVEAKNLLTADFARDEIGKPKVVAVANRLYRDLRVKVLAEQLRLDDRSCGNLLARHRPEVVAVCLDNVPGRVAVASACRERGIPVLQIGISDVQTAAVLWNEHWSPPSGQGDAPPCPFDLPLVMRTVGEALAVLRIHAEQQRQENRLIGRTRTERI